MRAPWQLSNALQAARAVGLCKSRPKHPESQEQRWRITPLGIELLAAQHDPLTYAERRTTLFAAVIALEGAGLPAAFSRITHMDEGGVTIAFSWPNYAARQVIEAVPEASGIEAATADETRSGSAEGESPTGEAGDAQSPEGPAS
jgi:hypothetical protein